jgi:TatD family-associated radical SAM protein
MYLDGVDTAQQLPAPSLEPIIEYPTATIAADTKPQTKVLLQEIQDQVQREDINFDSIVISGEGEPTLRLDDILELTKKVTETLSTQPLPPLRVTTNGLVPSDDTSQKLKRSGVSQVSVALMTSDKEQYETLMKPLIPDGHSAVCRFIKQSLESGLEVEVTAVDRQEIDKTKVEKLAKRLGVTSAVRWRTYFR